MADNTIEVAPGIFLVEKGALYGIILRGNSRVTPIWIDHTNAWNVRMPPGKRDPEAINAVLKFWGYPEKTRGRGQRRDL